MLIFKRSCSPREDGVGTISLAVTDPPPPFPDLCLPLLTCPILPLLTHLPIPAMTLTRLLSYTAPSSPCLHTISTLPSLNRRDGHTHTRLSTKRTPHQSSCPPIDRFCPPLHTMITTTILEADNFFFSLTWPLSPSWPAPVTTKEFKSGSWQVPPPLSRLLVWGRDTYAEPYQACRRRQERGRQGRDVQVQTQKHRVRRRQVRDRQGEDGKEDKGRKEGRPLHTWPRRVDLDGQDRCG